PPNQFVQDANTYKEYAEKDQVNLLQPPFFQVLQADPWLVPGQLPPQSVAAAVQQAFDPATFKGKMSDLTDEQKKQLQEYRKAEADRKRQEAAQKYRERNPSRAPSGGGGGGGGYRPPSGGGLNENSGLRGYSPAPIDGARPLTLAQAYRGT